MMPSVEIPRERWASYLEILGKVAAGRKIRIEVVGRDLGDQELSQFLPLNLLDYETRGSGSGDLLITVGLGDDELTHHIRDAVRLHAGFHDGGALEVLAIEEVEGGKTLVYFEEPLSIEVGPAADHAASP